MKWRGQIRNSEVFWKDKRCYKNQSILFLTYILFLQPLIYFYNIVTHLVIRQEVWIGVGQSVILLLTFASTVIPGFSFLEIHDRDFYSLLDMYVFRNGASFSTKGGGGGLSFYVGAAFVAP
jgi:hypothetical protein